MAPLPIAIHNCGDIAPSDWRFLEGRVPGVTARWSFQTSTPANALERAIRRPNLARLRACWLTAWRARRGDVIITHLPWTTWWVGRFSHLIGSRARHLAFSFNFTEIPSGARLRGMRRAFRQVERFVVYSRAEREAYTQAFGISAERIDVLPWAMQTPDTGSDAPWVEGPYICAIGGEGRDYASLLAAAKRLPDIPLVLAVRPHNLEGLDVPTHVRVFVNVPNTQFWNIVRHSAFAVVPLLRPDTACGHITLVGAMKLGKAVVSTYSRGTEDYISHDRTALMSDAGDVDALAGNIRRLWSDPALRARMEAAARHDGAVRHDELRWADYLRDFLLG